MSTESDLQAKTREAGQVIFVLGAVGFALFLLSQLGSQTAWVDNAKNFAAQPRFWPAVGVVTMVACFGLNFWLLKRRRPNGADWVEARRWLEPLEYVAWFMAYVFMVPILGFLPMSIAFAVGLTYRLGYRDRLFLWLAVAFAVGMVVLFKGLLSVRIPGAAIYEYFPGALRNFLILYL